MSALPGDRLTVTDSFVGRDEELAVLRGLLTGLAGGAGGAVLIEGEQGAGKTSLLRRALGDAASAGFRLGWGTTGELGRWIPLLLIRECLDSARLLRPGGPGAVGGAGPGAVASDDPVLAEMERLLTEVERLCARSPVVLVTEDLQWADAASLLMWQRLARAAARLPLLLAGTCRPVLGGEDLSGLRAELLASGGTVLSLGPLPARCPRWSRTWSGAGPVSAWPRRFGPLAATPCYISELVDALVRGRRVTVDQGVAELTAGAAGARVPATLAALIAERLSALPRQTVTVLRWAAVLGERFQVTDLRTVTGWDAAGLAGELRLAAGAHLIAEAGDAMAFRHGLVRQQLYEGVPPARLLHSQAARALADAGAPADQVAAQLALSAEGAAEWVREWLAGALPALAQRVPGTAEPLLRAVTDATPETDPRWERLQAGLVTAVFLLGRYDEAQQAGRRLLAVTRHPGQAAEATWLIAASLLRAGQPVRRARGP